MNIRSVRLPQAIKTRISRPTKPKVLMLLITVAVLAAVPMLQSSAQAFHYHYLSFADVPLPAGFQFFEPTGINNGGRVCGNAYDADFNPHVAFYDNGTITVLQPSVISMAQRINAGGTIGGTVVTDPVHLLTQAALFRGSNIELIPRHGRELSSSVFLLNDSGTAVVDSIDVCFAESFAIYRNGQVTPIDFGPNICSPPSFLSMNNAGIIAGTTFSTDTFAYLGFRFNPATGQAMLLHPILGDPDAWAQGINNRGDVLGYSFEFGATERIGTWDQNGAFTPYFVEGTPEIPTLSSRLLFNDNNLIVITLTTDPIPTSYIVPKTGVRLDLVSLVDNLPSDQALLDVFGINNHGDLLGVTLGITDQTQFFFLLQRNEGARPSVATKAITTAKPRSIPRGAALAIARRQMFKPGSSLKPLKAPLKNGALAP